MKRIPQDVIGDISILKFKADVKKSQKKKYATKILKDNKNIKVVLEKSEKVSGRLRKIKTSYVAGEKRKTTIHKENDCKFFLDVDETYFSPRLSNERKLISKKISRKDSVLVLFAGVAPFSIVIAKLAKPKKVVSVEINKKATKYAERNVRLNKLSGNIEVVQADVKKLDRKIKARFDKIIMPRPNLKDTFLPYVLGFSKKGTRIFYYGFGAKIKVLDEIKKGIGKRKKVKIIKIRKAGEIAPYKYRWLAEFSVL